MPGVYLDNAATSRPFPEVVKAMETALETGYGNPSARHRMGLEAARVVEQARRELAGAIGARPEEIVLTGGGSEANNLALKGVAWAYGRAGRHMVVSSVEHPSILETASWLEESLGFDVTRLPVDGEGRVDTQHLREILREDTLLVSLMHVNNEVGTIEPVAEAARLVRAGRPASGRRKGLPLLHVDAVQSLARIPIDMSGLGADLLSVSAHKLHGPKGVGALFVRKGVRLVPLIHGGGHENGRRSGTENVPGLAGFGAALELIRSRGPLEERAAGLAGLRDRLLERVRAGYPDVVLNGPARTWTGQAGDPDGFAAPHILSLSFPGLPAEVLQHHLEEAGVFVSTGSACSSHHQGRPSHVLEAMNRPPEVTASAVRLSLSLLTTAEEIERAGEVVAAVASGLAGTRPGRR